jgi:hypothetical protein
MDVVGGWGTIQLSLSFSWSQNITPHYGAGRFFKSNKETALCDINFDQSCFTICVRPAEAIFLGNGPFLHFSAESVQHKPSTYFASDLDVLTGCSNNY